MCLDTIVFLVNFQSAHLCMQCASISPPKLSSSRIYQFKRMMNFKVMRLALSWKKKKKLEVCELGCCQCENKPAGRSKRGEIKLKAKQLNEMRKPPNCVNQMYWAKCYDGFSYTVYCIFLIIQQLELLNKLEKENSCASVHTCWFFIALSI